MQPTILVFACNWDGWSSMEAATSEGLSYPASVKVVRISCLSRIHMGLILNAFNFGADGVLLLGCEPGKCHYCSDSDYVINEYEKTREIMALLGIWKDRLSLVHLPAFDGQGFVNEINKLVKEIEGIPAARRSKLIGSEGIHQEPVKNG